MERKRRDHIKDSFTALRDAVPSLQGEKVVSVGVEQFLYRSNFSKRFYFYTFLKFDCFVFRSNKNLKQASRAQILKKAADYITLMKRKNHSHQQDNDDLRKQNTQLDAQSMC